MPASRLVGRVVGRTVAIYAVVGGLWILFSDRILIALVRDPDAIERAGILKGWLFIAVTSLLLYTLLARGLDRMKREVARRQEAESALRERELELEHAHEIAQIGRWSASVPAGTVHLGRKTARLFGLSVGEHRIEATMQLVHPEDRAAVTAAWEAALASGDYDVQHRVSLQHGVRWLHVRAQVQRDAAGRPLSATGILQDITPAKEAEIALRESEERFRQVVENIDEVFWLTDRSKQHVLYLSPRFETIWGRARAEIYGAPERWIECIHPADRAQMRQSFLDGDRVENAEERYRIMRPDGSIRWIQSRMFSIRDEKGGTRNHIGVAADVTDRKNLEEQFLRAQRMEAIGTLAGGVAHDLNNILAPVLMSAGLLQETVADERDLRLVRMIEQSAQRGAGIVRQLLSLSRGSDGQRILVQLHHLTKEMAAIMRETFPREIAICVDVAKTLPPVFADPTQLHQVLMNLCVNARDAMPGGGTLTLTADEAPLPAASGDQPPAGSSLRIVVADTGTGIATEHLARIFDPFFTTKPMGQGTGLGLATVSGIVKSLGGAVTVESEPGRGTRFTVLIPAALNPPELPALQPVVHRRGAGQLILLVDDEPSIRAAGRTLLEHHGYRVICAADGREALDQVMARQGDIALVLTDVMMPVLGGVALVAALRERNIDVPIIATSGMAADRSRDEINALGVVCFLQKPSTPDELLGTIEKALAGA